MRGAILLALLLSMAPGAVADPPPVCDAAGCPTTEDTDGDGEADEAHYCNTAGCVHADDRDADGSADHVSASAALGEPVTVNSHTNLTSRESRTQAYVADEPDAGEYLLVYVLADVDASDEDDVTRPHEATLYGGVWLVDDPSASYEELAGVEAYAHDHDGGPDEAAVAARSGIE